MSIQYNTTLGTHTAVDSFGVVLAIYNPDTHGTLADFRATAKAMVDA